MTDIVVTDSVTVVQLQQVAGSARLRVLDVSAQSVPFWQPSSYVGSSGFMRPTDANENGFVYKTNAAGVTGAKEPTWPVTGTVTDGSLTWTTQTPPAAGSDTVNSATWSQVNPPDNTLTITGQSTTPLTASALIGGGTAGKAYPLLVSITMASGQVYNIPLLISITAQ